MTKLAVSNGYMIAEYVAGTGGRKAPSVVLDAARFCLTDWLGVAIGAADEEAARIVRDVTRRWGSTGRATILLGGTSAAPIAALCNGTLAHCLDFDDTYIKSLTHVSAPVWAATLALGEEIGASETEMLAAFITGFEVASRTGYGLGDAVTARGWHATGVFGRLGAAAASAALLKLDAERSLNALGAAATQTSGLVASFGTMSKPFHAGKAAMDGVLSAQLAAAGFRAAENLLEPGGGLDSALIQDHSLQIMAADFSHWEILNNSFKPYAACHQTHPAIDAAREIRKSIGDPRNIEKIDVYVSPLAKKITGEKSGTPGSPLEGKFDIKFCIALALHGAEVSASDFREPWKPDAAIFATGRKVNVETDERYSVASSRFCVTLTDGRTVETTIREAKGHPGNAMSWDDMWSKFRGLVEPRLGNQTRELFTLLRSFGNGEALASIRALGGA